MRARFFVVVASVGALTAFAACGGSPPSAPRSPAEENLVVPPLVTHANDDGGAVARATASDPGGAAPDADGPPPTETVATGGADPLGGKFTLADATGGLSGGGPLVATIDTTEGALRCRLFDDKAPNTVANFIGLARGLRPFRDPGGAWVKRPAYDGTTFHRVIRGFMIQGGDPLGTGKGEPGYTIPDETWPGAKHDRAGLLCMANRGPDTNGMQFFVTDASTPHLDPRGARGNAYTIFGECSPLSVVHAIAAVPVSGERPTTEVRIRSVRVTRGAPLASP